jgi:aminopeptidase-like protein
MTTSAIRHARPRTDREAILGLTRELCDFRTGVVAHGNDALFARIAAEMPLHVHRFPSGDTHNGWRVPPLCAHGDVRVTRGGETVLRGDEHPLVVAAGSRAFSGEVDLEELRRHLVTDPARPDAYVFHCQWQYRPWQADWALSMPHARAAALPPGRYRVEIPVREEAGDMPVGEAVLPGADERAFVFNSHTCHPGQANDGMVGVATLVRLYHHLAARPRRFTYRFVFGPEHLGTVFLLRDMPEAVRRNLFGGVFVEMTGVPAPLVATSTFHGGHVLDRAFAHVLSIPRVIGTTAGWREGAGNDETVWEAPGYEIPFVELTRRVDTFAPYPEYHSSLDTPDSLHGDRVEEAFRALADVVDVLERDCTVHRRFDGLVCLSNPDYDLYPHRPDPAIDVDVDETGLRWGRLVDRALRWMDGSMTCLDMAQAVGLPFGHVRDWLGRFEERGLAELRPATVERPRVATAG